MNCGLFSIQITNQRCRIKFKKSLKSSLFSPGWCISVQLTSRWGREWVWVFHPFIRHPLLEISTLDRSRHAREYSYQQAHRRWKLARDSLSISMTNRVRDNTPDWFDNSIFYIHAMIFLLFGYIGWIYFDKTDMTTLNNLLCDLLDFRSIWTTVEII